MAKVKPYFETIVGIYVRAALDMYHAAIAADYDTADPAHYLAKGNELRTLALESWTLTTRQERTLAGLKARAELNTPEGRARRDRLVASLSPARERVDPGTQDGFPATGYEPRD